MKHHVKYDDPHIQSQAAKILLKRNLRMLALKDWLDVRSAYLLRQRQIAGDLVCFYCNKPNLIEELPESWTKADLRRLATIDHVIPTSKGGPMFDESNFVLACHPCNQQKSDKIPEA